MTTEQQIRNDAMEEAAHLLELEAGEGFNEGRAYRACAAEIRRLKVCPSCGLRMALWFDGKNWQEHRCR
jgi:hypothetical protein